MKWNLLICASLVFANGIFADTTNRQNPSLSSGSYRFDLIRSDWDSCALKEIVTKDQRLGIEVKAIFEALEVDHSFKNERANVEMLDKSDDLKFPFPSGNIHLNRKLTIMLPYEEKSAGNVSIGTPNFKIVTIEMAFNAEGKFDPSNLDKIQNSRITNVKLRFQGD